MSQNYRFSWALTGGQLRCPNWWDTPVATTSSFITIPSVGSIVPNWLLVVPRRQMTNLSGCTSEELFELGALAASVATKICQPGMRVFFFEHGAQQPGSATGCGVDQAHLHIVPLPFDLIAEATADYAGWRTAADGLEGLSQLSSVNEYLWLSEWQGETRCANLEHPRSQYFRKLIASALGRANEWDYRTHPGLNNVEATLLAWGQQIPETYAHQARAPTP